MPVESIKVPDLGDAKDVEVIELLVSAGQSVKENDSLLVLESDKAAMEIPSPKSGKVKSIKVKLGDQVSEGHEILTLEVEASAAAEDKTSSKDKKPAAEEKQTAADDKAGDKKAEARKADAGKAAATKSAPAKKASSAATELISVPDLGGDSDVEVIEVHVKPGDQIKVEDALITLESDKAAMEVPAPKAGEVKALKLKVGDKVSAGSPILDLLVSGADSDSDSDSDEEASAPTEAAAEKAEEESSADASAEQDKTTNNKKQDNTEPDLQEKQQAFAEAAAQKENSKVYAGPAVRKLARELGVDLTQVSGTGAKGRIQKEDIHGFVKQRLQAPQQTGSALAVAAVPDIDFSQFGEVEETPMSKLHRLTAANMQRNWNTVPHVFQMNEADITDLENFRTAQRSVAEKKGVKLTLLPFLLKACAKCLQEYKQFNVSLHSSGEYLIQKKYIHIGVAVATEAGLVVPVIRDVDSKSLWELAAELGALTDKAKQRRLGKDDMQGACFTISSLGAIGGTGFTPIVNAPEVAILGVSRTVTKPVYSNGQFIPRQMLPVTLSYDHRAVNGVDAGQFATYLAEVLGDIRLLLL
ncbi:MAG: dihydrolipoyllysine-residue acetyltransferase [Pseudomonadales bacterium]|nr:dihydrolipoyllysine-residue acetyltransferase [Pseudomonadales bacterium]